MGPAFAKILSYVAALIPVLPQLIAGIEAIWKGREKSGANKWIALEQAVSGIISTVAQEVSQLAPDKTVDQVSAAIAVFTKKVNDAFVELCNSLGIFEHSS